MAVHVGVPATWRENVDVELTVVGRGQRRITTVRNVTPTDHTRTPLRLQAAIEDPHDPGIPDPRPRILPRMRVVAGLLAPSRSRSRLQAPSKPPSLKPQTPGPRW